MTSADERFVITFNGEIYNHLDLRKTLERQGAAPRGGWRGSSDTETLLAGARAWSIDELLKAAVGMFAFALWDNEKKQITLARDRFGEKPLYVSRIGRGIAFASELKAITGLPGFERQVNWSALQHFLEHGYVQAPATIYAATGKLVPGSFVTLSEADVAAIPTSGDFLSGSRQFYWRMIDVAMEGLKRPFTGTDGEAVDELDSVLSDAVSRQQISDVPIGAFLSGGIDSTAIAAFMQVRASAPIKTFTIGFEEAEYDESKYAERVAAYLGTDHTTVMMSHAEALERVAGLPAIWDEPFADVSQLPMLLLSEAARRIVTVALSGDGGDELFGGYARYTWTERAWPKTKRIPLVLRRTLANAITTIPPTGWNRILRGLPDRFGGATVSGDRLHKISALLRATNLDGFYDHFLSSWRSSTPLLLNGTPPVVPHWSGYPALPTLPETLMFRDAVDYMPDDVLVKVDRAAMSVSLETRAPMLDPQVAAFAWRLPLAQKRSGGMGKLTLRRLVHRYVPQELVERPKAGFSVPLDAWLRGPMRSWAEDYLSEHALTEAGLNASAIRRVWRAHLDGSENHRYFIWNVLTYQAWRNHHFS